MQSVLQPVLASRISAIVGNPYGDHDRILIVLPEPPFAPELFDDATLLAIIKRLIHFKGIRNPKAYRDCFRAIDNAHNGDMTDLYNRCPFT